MTTVPGGVGSETTVPETTAPETTVAGVAPTAGGGNGPGSGVLNEDTNQTTAGPSTAATGGVSSGTLARTGSNSAPWALLGSSLIVAGLVLVGLGNRKRLAEG